MNVDGRSNSKGDVRVIGNWHAYAHRIEQRRDRRLGVDERKYRHRGDRREGEHRDGDKSDDPEALIHQKGNFTVASPAYRFIFNVSLPPAPGFNVTVKCGLPTGIVLPFQSTDSMTCSA